MQMIVATRKRKLMVHWGKFAFHNDHQIFITCIEYGKQYFRNKLLNNDEDNATPEKIPEYSLSEERQDTRRWLKVTLPSGEKRTIDMKVS